MCYFVRLSQTTIAHKLIAISKGKNQRKYSSPHHQPPTTTTTQIHALWTNVAWNFFIFPWKPIRLLKQWYMWIFQKTMVFKIDKGFVSLYWYHDLQIGPFLFCVQSFITLACNTKCVQDQTCHPWSITWYTHWYYAFEIFSTAWNF